MDARTGTHKKRKMHGGTNHFVTSQWPNGGCRIRSSRSLGLTSRGMVSGERRGEVVRSSGVGEGSEGQASQEIP